MPANFLQPANGSTHLAIVGTYNKVIAIVRHGENMKERIEKAIHNGFTETVASIDMIKGVVWLEYPTNGNFHHPRIHIPMRKEPIKFEQVKEY